MAADIVQEIKLRTDLVELISTYVPLRQSGSTYKGLCPFHSEKTPSFTVNRERGLFKCWGCGVGGDCFSFLEKQQGLSFNEAGEVLARRLGLEWLRTGDTQERRSERERLFDINALGERFFRQSLEAAPAVLAYLERRGLTRDTSERFRLGYAPPGYEALLAWLRRQKLGTEDALKADLILQGEQGLRDRFVDRVIFPICDLEGRTIAFGGRTMQADGIPKYLNSRETPIFQKGRTLYGLHLARKAIEKAGFVVAVEGYMDLIALHQAGIENTVASLGTAITETHVGILRRFSDQLVFCYDGDGPGMRAAVRNSTMFETAGCAVRVARLPAEQDPDTYVKERGPDAFRALLNQAEPLLDYQLNQLRTRHDLGDERARLPFVREAARIIAQSGSHLVRQEYAARLTRTLDRLAEEWYPGDPHQGMQARVALGHEVSRLLRTDRVNRAGVKEPAQAAPKVRISSRTRAERYVLRAALSDDHWAAEVAGRLPVAAFATPDLRGLAESLFQEGQDGLWDCLERVRNNPASAEVVSALLMEESPLDAEGLAESIGVLERAWMEQRKQELRRALAEGELAEGDSRRTELVGLLRELGGRQRRED